MNNRRLFIASAAGLAATASGTWVLTSAFDPPKPAAKPSELLKLASASDNKWLYHALDLDATADIAYQLYPKGSCMFATFGSVITQLAEQYGEPYASFPYEMMKYGATGIGGYGSVCGSLNAAAALMGLFVSDKSHRNALIEECFSWYEKTALPRYAPADSPIEIKTTVSNSVLCHASTAKWCKATHCRVDSDERAERCSRLSADVARKAAGQLNQYVSDGFETRATINDDTASCVQCHSDKGKLGNIKGKMECAPCHEGSVAHSLFADVHYKFME